MTTTMTNSDILASINDTCVNVPRIPNTQYTYGTAGFRTRAELLDSTLLRCGILAAIRSMTNRSVHNCVGVMITASHNPVQDNGVKLADFDGDMLIGKWEEYATILANSEENEVHRHVERITKELNIEEWNDVNVNVMIGWDTRPSSKHLADLVKRGVACFNGTVIELGVVTTPQLHYCVRQYNMNKSATLNDYYTNLCSAFTNALGPNKNVNDLVIDCANGVGFVSVNEFATRLKPLWNISYINADDIKDNERGLNNQCGAEHVQKKRTLPINVDRTNDVYPKKRFASIDGDADRVVFFYVNDDGVDDTSQLGLLDGDKITALVSTYIIDLLKQSGLLNQVNIGIVQTAYANGASTIYLNSLGLPIICVPTGVKHLHHKAIEYDIGIYFEANGHGTVMFSKKAIRLFQSSNSVAARTLLCLTRLINQAVGDALSDILLVELILTSTQMSLKDWNELYVDLPSKQDKVKVPDRRVVTTSNAERECMTPVGLQDRINELIHKYGDKSRAFIRPSGTEDVVRIYAESSTQHNANMLASDIATAIKQYCK